jgi:hypothetical protein
MIEVGVMPEGRGFCSGGVEKTSVFHVRHLASCEQEFVDPHTVHRTLAVLADFRAQ